MIYCSIGENCLGQGVLERKKLATVLGPFAWARSNIDYLIALIEEDFANLLNPAYLQHRERYNKQIATNSKYQCAQGVFCATVSSELEFTHHDVLSSGEARENIARKTQRFREILRSDVPAVFIYHHRPGFPNSHTYVMRRLNRFAELVRQRRPGPFSVVCFTQSIVKKDGERRVDLTRHGECLKAVFCTYQQWGGNDKDVFWGIVDDDLFDGFFDAIGQEFAAGNMAEKGLHDSTQGSSS